MARKPRSPRSTSIEGQRKAFDAVLSAPLHPPGPLDGAEATIWSEIVNRRMRSEWEDLDLRTAYRLAKVMCRLGAEEATLHREGFVLAGRRNPRAGIVRELGQESLRLQRFLRLHPASDGRAPGIVRGGREAELEARRVLDPAWRPTLVTDPEEKDRERFLAREDILPRH